MAIRGILVTSLLICTAAQHTVLIKPNREECFFEEIQEGTPVMLETFVLLGGSLDIRLKFSKPTMDELKPFKQVFTKAYMFKRNSMEDAGGPDPEVFEFTTSVSGIHRFCYSNSIGRKPVSKHVQFQLFLGGEVISAAKREKATTRAQLADGLDLLNLQIDDENIPKEAKTMKQYLDLLDTGVKQIKFQQMGSRRREAVHHATVNSNNSNIMNLAILETIVAVVLVCIQFFVVRRWFNSDEGLKQWA